MSLKHSSRFSGRQTVSRASPPPAERSGPRRSGLEAAVDVHRQHVRRAGAEHRQQRRDAAEQGAPNHPPESPPAFARQEQLTWCVLAKLAGIPNANTVRDIEYGRDAQLSTVQAVAHALGLRLDLIEEKV